MKQDIPLLYTYFRSSAAYRVRIALAIKQIDYTAIPVHLLKDGGQQLLPSYRTINPAGLVPSFVDNGAVLSQSLAIIEYLEERHPQPPLLPGDPLLRAHTRQIAQAIACDIHPINNLRVLKYLTQNLGVSQTSKQEWIRHWMQTGLEALEQTIANQPWSGQFCVGDSPTIADCCLVPQLFNARRYDIDLSNCPRLVEIDARCNQLSAFAVAHPSQAPDAE